MLTRGTRRRRSLLIASALFCGIVTCLFYYSPTRVTALHRAVLANDISAVKAILMRDSSKAPAIATRELFFAKSADMAKCLIGAGGAPNASDDRSCSPLHFAAGAGRADVAAVLLANGAVVNIRDAESRTPLHWVAFEFSGLDTNFDIATANRSDPSLVQTASVLLAYGAQADARDSGNHTPLYDAAGGDNADLVELLLDAGANPNAATVDGNTPLHNAMIHGNRTVQLLLIERGAETSKKNWEGKTPEQVREQN
jgi:ankyrin repeat protein